MIKTYPYNSTLKLSEHFQASEFKCKCGGNHEIKIDEELINKLERLRGVFGGKIVITSGYRCPAHSVAVGGYGGDRHTKGQAADIKVYYPGGKIVDTRLVACAAQTIGFYGIGNIDKTYTAIHVDTREAVAKWYGDEAKPNGSTGSVTNDYYNYYGVDKAKLFPVTETHKLKLYYDDKLIFEKEL